MRLGKTTLLVITAGVFIIALAGVGMVYFQQVHEQNHLNEQLALAQSRLSGLRLEQLSSQQAELGKQLSQATSQFEAVKTILAQPIGSIAVSNILFDIAEAHGLEVTEITAPGLAIEGLEGITYSVIPLSATVEGDVPNLVNFVTKLNSHLATGVVKSITITIPETDSEEKASADIQLVVYTYRGD